MNREQRAVLAAAPRNMDVLLLASAYRKLRDAGEKLLASRYADGAVDGMSLRRFEEVLEEVREEMESEGAT